MNGRRRNIEGVAWLASVTAGKGREVFLHDWVVAGLPVVTSPEAVFDGNWDLKSRDTLLDQSYGPLDQSVAVETAEAPGFAESVDFLLNAALDGPGDASVVNSEESVAWLAALAAVAAHQLRVRVEEVFVCVGLESSTSASNLFSAVALLAGSLRVGAGVFVDEEAPCSVVVCQRVDHKAEKR